MILDFKLTKYEAYLMDATASDERSLFLPLTSLLLQMIIVIVLAVSAFNINLSFKTNKNGKPRIENTLKFKWLNIVYSFIVFLMTILHYFVMQVDSNESFIIQYDITTTLTLALLTILLSNEDSRKFWARRMENLKEDLLWLFRARRRNKVFPTI